MNNSDLVAVDFHHKIPITQFTLLNDNHGPVFMGCENHLTRSPCFIFFGASEGFTPQEFSNELHVLDLVDVCNPSSHVKELTWKLVQVESEKKPSKRITTLIYDPTKQQLIAFYGYSYNRSYLGDVWLFDLDTRRWKELETTGIKPSPRTSSVTCLSERSELIVYGGYNGQKHLDDFFVLDLKTATWRTEQFNNASPGVLTVGNMNSLICNQTLFVIGGYSPHTFSRKIHTMDLNTLKWKLSLCKVWDCEGGLLVSAALRGGNHVKSKNPTLLILASEPSDECYEAATDGTMRLFEFDYNNCHVSEYNVSEIKKQGDYSFHVCELNETTAGILCGEFLLLVGIERFEREQSKHFRNLLNLKAFPDIEITFD